MSLLRHMLLVLALLTFGSGAVQARQLSAAEQNALRGASQRFITALTCNDFEAVLEIMPARLVRSFAASAGLTPSAFKKQLAAQTKALLSDVRFVHIEFEPAQAEAYRETESGLVYGYAPSVFWARLGGEIVRIETEVLVIKEGDRWRLVRVESGRLLTALVSAFPELKGLQPPRARRSNAPPPAGIQPIVCPAA